MPSPPQPGDRFPLDVELWQLAAPTAEGKPSTSRQPVAIKPADLFRGKKKTIVVGIPGAYTPGCSRSHVPGFLEATKELQAKGVDQVIIVSTADAFVMDAFAESLGPQAKEKLLFLSDGNHELTRALGLEFDASARGMGKRMQRFAMVVDGDGVVKDVQVDAGGSIKLTRAGHLLSRM